MPPDFFRILGGERPDRVRLRPDMAPPGATPAIPWAPQGSPKARCRLRGRCFSGFAREKYCSATQATLEIQSFLVLTRIENHIFLGFAREKYRSATQATLEIHMFLVLAREKLRSNLSEMHRTLNVRDSNKSAPGRRRRKIEYFDIKVH